jgi:hypothetical protein
MERKALTVIYELHCEEIYPQSFTELHGRYPHSFTMALFWEEALMEKLKLSYLMSRLEIRACSSGAWFLMFYSILVWIFEQWGFRVEEDEDLASILERRGFEIISLE